MAITFGGNPYSWNSGNEITLWVMAGVLFIAFCLSQAFPLFVDPEYRVYPVGFLRKRVLVTLQTLIFCAALNAFVSLHYRSSGTQIELLIYSYRIDRSRYTTSLSSFSSPRYLSISGRNNNDSALTPAGWDSNICSCTYSPLHFLLSVLYVLQWWTDAKAGLLHALVSIWCNSIPNRGLSYALVL